MNLKNKCAVCKKDLVYFRQVLMMGPRGYRRYALCDRCAGKVNSPSPRPSPAGRGGRQKAGV